MASGFSGPLPSRFCGFELLFHSNTWPLVRPFQWHLISMSISIYLFFFISELFFKSFLFWEDFPLDCLIFIRCICCWSAPGISPRPLPNFPTSRMKLRRTRPIGPWGDLGTLHGGSLPLISIGVITPFITSKSPPCWYWLRKMLLFYFLGRGLANGSFVFVCLGGLLIIEGTLTLDPLPNTKKNYTCSPMSDLYRYGALSHSNINLV